MGDDRIAALERVAERVHHGQVDQQGAPYILHLRRVANAVSGPAKPVALFHDAIEDHRISPDQLRALLTADGYAAVLAVTRDPDRQTYAEFIESIAARAGRVGEIAREVKRADVADNLGRLTPDLERLRARYEAALKHL